MLMYFRFCRCAFVIIVVFFVSMTACKKSSDKDPDEFPVLGTCKPTAPVSELTYASATGLMSYQTKGGSNIEMNKFGAIVIRHAAYEGFKIELWGDNDSGDQPVYLAIHESLNGKHIKDRVGSRRSIILPGGAKLTLVANGEAGRIQEISIYDGDIVHHINLTCNTLELSTKNKTYASHFDEIQADGETSTIEITSEGLTWVNIYQEDTPGNKVQNRQVLGILERANPNRVTDMYDDPRRSDT